MNEEQVLLFIYFFFFFFSQIFQTKWQNKMEELRQREEKLKKKEEKLKKKEEKFEKKEEKNEITWGKKLDEYAKGWFFYSFTLPFLFFGGTFLFFCFFCWLGI